VLHWLTVAGVGETVLVTLLMTSTLHSTVPPPPPPEPLHWATEVTRSVDRAVEVVQTIVAGALAAPWHSVSAMEEFVTDPLTSLMIV
jgi:hypothetical protein